MNAIDHFATEAARFEAWAQSSDLHPERAVRNALLRIVSLYLAALQLSPPLSAKSPTTSHAERLTNTNSVIAHLTIPIDAYSEIFHPLVVPPEEPVIGSLGDDVRGIYQDVARGLRAYESGDHTGALWEWEFGFKTHWGEHATGAIRALHAWLAMNTDIP